MPSLDADLGAASPSRLKDAAPDLALPWVIRLRYGIAFGEAVIVLWMAYGLQLDLPIFWTLTPVGVVLITNLLLARARRALDRFPQETLGAVFILDTFCLTALLGLTGGPMNPFSLLYLVQITLSAIVLRKLWTWVLAALSGLCFGVLFFFYVPSPAFESHHAEPGISPHLVGMWIAFIVAAGLITFFTGKVSDALRRREQEVLALQARIARHERLASLVTLAAGAAHELGTPLGTIAVVSRELERYADLIQGDDAIREDARLIRSEVERCRLILQRMSAEGAEPMGESARQITLAELFRETLDKFPDTRRAEIHMEAPNHQSTVVLPVQATVQSLAALIQNGIDASLPGARVLLRGTVTGGEAAFEVRDGGHGMPEDVLRRIAEPFFTTKEPGKGMGLGTFLVRTFAERLGGELTYESSPGRGTKAVLRLPANTSTQDAHAAV